MARDIRLKLLAEVNDAIKNLKRIEKELGGVRKEGQGITKIFKNVKATIGGFVGALALREAAQFTREVVALNDKSKDLRRSLDGLAKKEGLETIELMEDLRTATGNTVDDITLMQSATRGKFLGVDLKNLPTLFEFARQRAKDTGEEVGHPRPRLVAGGILEVVEEVVAQDALADLGEVWAWRRREKLGVLGRGLVAGGAAQLPHEAQALRQ